MLVCRKPWGRGTRDDFPNPFAPDPINCFCCGTEVIKDRKMLQMYVIPYPGIKCPNCRTIVVPSASHFL